MQGLLLLLVKRQQYPPRAFGGYSNLVLQREIVLLRALSHQSTDGMHTHTRTQPDTQTLPTQLLLLPFYIDT